MLWRAFNRLIGITLMLGALGFAAILVSVLRTEDWRGSGWTLPVFAVIAIGLLVAGRYYFRMNPDAPDQPSSSTPFSIFLVDHRDQLKVLALTGLGLTLVYLGAACLGNQAWWPLLPLGIGAAILRSLGSKIAGPKSLGNRDWQRVPARVRGVFPLVKTILDTALLLMLLLFCWNDWSPHAAPKVPVPRFVFQAVVAAEIAFLYALEALFFEYGELRTASATDPQPDTE